MIKMTHNLNSTWNSRIDWELSFELPPHPGYKLPPIAPQDAWIFYEQGTVCTDQPVHYAYREAINAMGKQMNKWLLIMDKTLKTKEE